MTRAYIGIKPCGCATAILVDDAQTTAQEVAQFAREMSRSDRRVENVTIDEGRTRLHRCPHKESQE